jgi:hypothetical protein
MMSRVKGYSKKRRKEKGLVASDVFAASLFLSSHFVTGPYPNLAEASFPILPPVSLPPVSSLLLC